MESLVVRKDLADKFRGRFAVPTYVGEFLIGKYCATSDEEEIQEGLEEVERLLSTRVVRTGEQELFKAKTRELGEMRIIDLIKARLDHRKGKDEYIAELPSLQMNDIRIGRDLVVENDRMLTGGFYAEVGLVYMGGEERPFVITDLRPIQAPASLGLDRLAEAREGMSSDDWKILLLRSIGLEPSAFTVEAQNAYFLRMVPFVVRNYNMVELGPRGTGKSHLFQQISPFAYLLSGGQTTVAQLFVNNATGQRGLVTQHDVVAFDEIAGIKFRDIDGVNVMKGYMASGEFSRGKESIKAEGGMAFLGNFQVDVHQQLRTGHLLGPMPEVMRDDTAFMDRLHAYVPGWDIPPVGPGQKTAHYGLVSDMLAQWWHDLRRQNRWVRVRQRVQTNDAWRGRDIEAMERTVDGLLKLLYPDPESEVSSEDLQWAVELATVARRRVKEAQASIGAEEFGRTDLGYRIDGGSERIPVCPESEGLNERISFAGLGPRVEPDSDALPSRLPAILPPGFPILGYGQIVSGPLGEGAFGSVYKVKRDYDGQVFAGKLFKRGEGAAYGDLADEMLQKEVKALESLTHDNIVRVIGPIKMTSAGEWMILSEWIDGGTLEAAASGRAEIPDPMVFNVGLQCIEALEYLEKHGLVHRDIKPANMMLDRRTGRLKLIDFNLMRTEGHQTGVAGTKPYMPPDTMFLGATVDSQVDRYGVGVVLYELLTHRLPYPSPFLIASGESSAMPFDPRDERPDLAKSVVDFLAVAIAPLAEERFPDAYTMRQAWLATQADLA